MDNQNIQIIQYIKNSLASGISKEDIYKNLLGRGWSIDLIQQNFDAIDSEKKSEEAPKKAITVILIIAAVLVGAGIFSFIASNWQNIEKPFKIGIIFTSMLASYTVGWLLKERTKLKRIGESLFLLGSIIYGSGIFLIAQMFHTTANWPDGFILWMIGSIVMAFAIEAYSIFFMAIILGVVSLIGYPWGLLDGINTHSFIFTPSILLCASTVITLVSGLVIRKKIPPNFKDFY
ncbi:MAG: DUF2157 domain-containing protein [Candidatus Moranbacteria bacterium]|nr:DUF2157 domain-containing protein [Candidatus Moranbacteria bacterium]